MLAGAQKTFFMNTTLNEFLTGIIDYAGLFPPAALEMETAVRNYSAYCKSPFVRWLGRFVLPVARLDEFDRAASGLIPENHGWESEIWRMSALAGADLKADVETILRFNDRHLNDAIRIDTLEAKAGNAEQIRSGTELIPKSITPYFEIQINNDLPALIGALADIGARAKVRTGGVTADAFPSPAALARFIALCAEADVPFKATAGLHHPFRSVQRLTYEAESASALMHGFLNVFLAAAFAQNGLPAEQIEQLLDERSPAAFHFEEGAVIWRDRQVVRAHLRNTRSLFALSFGSCSFEEPIEDLKSIGLL
jgi:hypothetical protein